MQLQMTRREFRDQLEARVREHLEDAYGDDPFTPTDAAWTYVEGEEALVYDQEPRVFTAMYYDALSAITRIKGEWVNGHPRYLGVGRGHIQKAEAVPLEKLLALRDTTEAMVVGWLRRDLWLSKLVAAKTGVQEDDVEKVLEALVGRL